MSVISNSKAPSMLIRAVPLLILIALILVPVPAFADVQSSLMRLKQVLTGTILPVVSVIGMALAATSFFTGNPQAKQHVIYAVLGCVFGFGAQAIVDLLSSIVK